MMQIEIFTDGSCKGNPGPGGWCAIFLEQNSDRNSKKIFQKPFKVLKGRADDTTNNRMEMTAVIEALRYLDHGRKAVAGGTPSETGSRQKQQQKLSRAQITLFSDSNLIIQTLLQGWKRKANLDLWEELDCFNEELEVEYVWVKGHAKNHWNNECDKIAQKEASLAAKNRKELL